MLSSMWWVLHLHLTQTCCTARCTLQGLYHTRMTVSAGRYLLKAQPWAALLLLACLFNWCLACKTDHPECTACSSCSPWKGSVSFTLVVQIRLSLDPRKILCASKLGLSRACNCCVQRCQTRTLRASQESVTVVCRCPMNILTTSQEFVDCCLLMPNVNLMASQDM